MDKKYSEKNAGLVPAVCAGIIIGYTVLISALLISAVIMAAAKLTSGAAVTMATVSLAAAGFVAGFASSKKFGSRAVIIGTLTGSVFYLTVAVISLIITGGGVSSLFVLRMCLTIAAALVGSIFGAVRKSSKNMI